MRPKGTNQKQFVPTRKTSNLLIHVQDALETTEQKTQNTNKYLTLDIKY